MLKCLKSLTRNITDVKEVLQILKRKTGLKRMSKLAIAWWSIWYFRNQIVFNNISWDSKNIKEFIKRQHNNWINTKKEEKSDHIPFPIANNISEQRRKKKGIKWEKPDVGWYKLNFDGSVKDNGKTSTGYVIRDHEGKIISMKGESILDSSVIESEASSISKGIVDAVRRNIRDIIIEGDNMCVINALKGTWSCPWEVDMLIADSRLELRSFRTVRIRHVFRETNCVADRLASLGHTTTTSTPDTDL